MENKTYKAFPITEELLKKITEEFNFIGTEKISGNAALKIIELAILEQPAPLSVTEEKIEKMTSILIKWGHSEEAAKKYAKEYFSCEYCGGDGVYIDGDNNRLECPACIDETDIKAASKLQICKPPFSIGYVPTEGDKILLNRILKRGQPSFPSDEEKKFTEQDMINFVDWYDSKDENKCHDTFKKELDEWLSSYIGEIKKEETLEFLFEQHQKFSADKFPKSTWESSLRGLEREIKEVELARADYYVIDGKENREKLGLEYIDCFMYLLDSMKRVGFFAQEIKFFFKKKLEINKGREWKINNDGSYSHIKQPLPNPPKEGEK